MDADLFGSWVSVDPHSGEQTYLHIGESLRHEGDPKDQPGLMQAWLINTGKKNMGSKNDKEAWEVFTVTPPLGLDFSVWRSGDARIASISTNLDMPSFMAEEFAKGDGFPRDRYWLVKYRVTADKLEICAPDAKFLARAIKKESLKGSVEDAFILPETHIDETQENLRRFVEQNLDRGLFSKDPIATFKRVQVAKP